MSAKKKTDKVVAEAEATPTVITLVLPVDKTKPATVTVRNGDLGHLSSFAYDDFKDICTALNDGMRAFVGVQANPPKDIQSAKPVAKKTSKKASKKKAKAKGKAPYRLQDASGQTRTLSKMLDPFELQEKYHKANPKLKFDSVEEASEVAQILIEAGIEKTVTITYSNGEAVKVLPEKEDKASAEVVTSDDVSVAEAEIPVTTNHVVVNEEVVAEADEDVSVDTSDTGVPVITEESDEEATSDDDPEKEVVTEAVAPEVSEADTATDTISTDASADDPASKEGIVDDSATDALVVDATTSAKPAPVIQVLTSAELAKEEGMPEYNEFSLATDDDDDDTDSDESSTPVVETAQAKLF